MLLRLARVAGLLLLVTISLAVLHAEDLQTWNDLEYMVARSPRFEWTVEGVHRFEKTIGDVYDRRVKTAFEYKLTESVSIEAGYLFRNRDELGASVNENRFVAGIIYPILQGAIEVEGSTLYERHVVPVSDFNRYKQEIEVSQPGKTISPWLYQQFTFKQGSGFVRSRSRFGFEWRPSRYTFKAAYQFESLSKGNAWAPRHAIYTEISIDRPLWLRE